MFSAFAKAFAKGTGENLKTTAQDLMLKLDQDTFLEAGIAEIEAEYDTINIEFSQAKIEYDREQGEAVAELNTYNQRIAAAQHMGEQLEADPTNTKLEASLGKLMDVISSQEDDVQREQQEAVDAKEVMDDLKETVDMLGNRLKEARQEVKAAARDLEAAKRQKQRNLDKANRARVKAGVAKKATGLGSAVDRLREQAAATHSEADAAKRKAEMLAPTPAEEGDDAIKAAMAAVSGKPAPKTLSVKERLAALKAK